MPFDSFGIARLALDDREEPAWLDRACIVIPAFDAESTVGAVVVGLREAIPERRDAIIVVDDGSRDATARVARDLGCTVVPSSPKPVHEGSGGTNMGKGSALRAGFETARARGMTVALTVDADGQHPAAEARRVLLGAPSETSLVLGVRDLVRDGAPRANRFSNGISNYFLSLFARRPLHDTQCGLRRYPVEATLALGARSRGYDFEAEVLLRAVWSGLDVVELPVIVSYPKDRRTHFRVSRDPWRILGTVLATVGGHWLDSSMSPEKR
jgi:glycosyltransferase involved in cell wall biosynthesis